MLAKTQPAARRKSAEKDLYIRAYTSIKLASIRGLDLEEDGWFKFQPFLSLYLKDKLINNVEEGRKIFEKALCEFRAGM